MVVGHIRNNINVWKSITSDNIVLDWLKNGAKINFSLGDEDLDALNDDCKYLRHVSVGLRL